MASPLAAAALISVALGSGPASADRSTNAGEAVVVTGSASTDLRRDGGSATEFSLRLPQGASCPGDSANDGYRVQSFIVPATVDPGGLQYKEIAPDGDGRYALYETQSRAYVQEQTANSVNPGEPGLIINIPTLSYAVFPPGTLDYGRYHIGIACTLHNQTVRYWATDIVLRRLADDKPAGFRWTAVSAPTRSSKRFPAGKLASFGAAAIAVGAAAALRRRRQPSTSSTRPEAS